MFRAHMIHMSTKLCSSNQMCKSVRSSIYPSKINNQCLEGTRTDICQSAVSTKNKIKIIFLKKNQNSAKRRLDYCSRLRAAHFLQLKRRILPQRKREYHIKDLIRLIRPSSPARATKAGLTLSNMDIQIAMIY